MQQERKVTAESSRTYDVPLAALTSLFVLIGARWIWLYRRGQLLDIDEAGYFLIALLDYHALVQGGIAGWFSAVFGASVHGPLTTALASLLFFFTGPRLIVGFGLPLLAGAGCVVATYFLGESVASRPVGLVSSVLVASCPVVLSYFP